MVSVTKRIKQIKQPRGGYINPKQFAVTELNDGLDLHPDENIHSSVVGLAVDYLTRYNTGASAEEAFKISLLGASIIGESTKAKKLLSGVTGLDDKSITNACKLSGYDVCYRSSPFGFKPVEEIKPDSSTIDNIRIMVNRGISFIKEYGPIVKDGFTFDGGYTDIITAGDGDFLTETTIWDFKVSNKAPTNAHTLQLLIYYLMGLHSTNKEFQQIEKLGVFNPRLNTVYQLKINSIPQSIMDEVSTTVIGYQN